jgi:PAS domain S-box-containing protein
MVYPIITKNDAYSSLLAPPPSSFPPAEPTLVLVVDDDPHTRTNLCDLLEKDGFRVTTVATGAEALRFAPGKPWGAIILDRLLPDGTAQELLPRLQALAPQAAKLIVTGFSDLHGVIEALRQGAADFILKPINPEVLRASLARVVERQRLATAKERSETAFRTLVEAAPCLIFILRPDGTIAYFNEFAEQITGRRPGDCLGRAYLELFVPETFRGEVQKQFHKVLQGIPAWGFESPIRCQPPICSNWAVWNVSLLADYEGSPAILAVGQDISQLKEAQDQALQSARLAAIGQMMTGLAHESGNALARSQACLEMLALEVHDRPEALDLITRIQKAQDHLRQLYEEVRGYAAPLRLEREDWNLSSIWRQAWTNLEMERQGRNTYLTEETDGVNLHCLVDHFRLEQVFRNIFHNSLAACRDPVRIVIACTAVENGERSTLRVAVADNGPGLTAEQLVKIFDPFFTTKTKGTGLGMAIAKRIVAAHGGLIAVDDKADRGARILITLPRDLP